MKKYVSIAIALSLLCSLPACGGTAQTTVSTDSAAVATASSQDGTTLSGTIKSIDGNNVTITTADGAEKTFAVSDTTVYSLKMGEIPSDQAGGATPDMPEGGGQQGGTPPEMPNGEQPNGSPPEKPDGSAQQGGTPPEKPEGGGQQGGTPPEKPDGSAQQGGTPPEMPGDRKEMTASRELLTEGTEITVTISPDGTATEVEITIDGKPMGDFDGENAKSS